MIIFKCDCCGEEIKGTEEIGNFKIQEKSFSFIKHQKQDGMRVQEFLLCIACARKVRDYFQSLKRGNDLANSANE